MKKGGDDGGAIGTAQHALWHADPHRRAKKAMAAAEAEAIRNDWDVAIAIVDSGGNLVMLHRLDSAQLSSTRIVEAKARTAVEFRRPIKAFQDAVARGGKISKPVDLRALRIQLICGGRAHTCSKP